MPEDIHAFAQRVREDAYARGFAAGCEAAAALCDEEMEKHCKRVAGTYDIGRSVQFAKALAAEVCARRIRDCAALAPTPQPAAPGASALEEQGGA
jgi:hypothetical protein